MENEENIINGWEQIEPYEWNMAPMNKNYVEASSTNDDELTLLQIVPTTVTDPNDGTSSPSDSESGDEQFPSCGVAGPLDWRVRLVEEGKKLLKLRLERVRERVVGVATNWAMCIVAFWSFANVEGAAAVATLLVSLVYVGIRRWRRRRNVVVDRWDYLLKEKDEKISQLLFQIAQFNEVLSSRRRVPVHQIN